VGGAAKKKKGNFIVLFSSLRPTKSSVSISIIFESFPLHFFSSSRLARRFLSVFGCSPIVRSHFATTSHWPFAFAQDACSVLASCSLCGFDRVRGNSQKQTVPNYRMTQQIILLLPQPSHARASVAPLIQNLTYPSMRSSLFGFVG
jgi:hypothetical protein